MTAYLAANPTVRNFLFSQESGDLYWHLAKRTVGMSLSIDGMNVWRVVCI